ncbi:MAG: ABC transporter substrate-binding protein [Desulfobacteraceae bacterium]|jgi:branched-chain amino acid transport system substrate-binding protein
MKEKLKILVGVLALYVLASIMAPLSVASAAEPIVVGVVHSQKFMFSTMMKNSFEMALERINKEGGIRGRPLNLVYGDDQGNRRIGEGVIRKLVKETGVAVLVGGFHSSNTVYTARIADKLDKPFLICTAADDRITQRGWPNIFRLNPPASGYTAGLEEFFVNRLKPKSMAIIYENSPYGTSAGLRMMWFCREQGIDIQKIIPYHKERLKPDYYKRILSPLKAKGEVPDLIYMVSYLKDAIAVVREIRELELNTLLVGGAGGFTHPKFITNSGDSANFVVTATLWHQEIKNPGTKAYYDAYVRKYAVKPDYHGAEAYSALLVVSDALKRARSLSPEDIRVALDKTDMITPFGPVKFSAYGKFERQNSLPTQVLQIINGKFECIWPQDLATAKFVPPPK